MTERKTIRVAGAPLDSGKRLDIALRGVFGLGASTALALALDVSGVQPKGSPAPKGDVLGMLPKLGALDEARLAALGAALQAMEVEGGLRSKLARGARDRERLAQSSARQTERASARG